MSAPAMRTDDQHSSGTIRADDRLLVEMMLAQQRIGVADAGDPQADEAARAAEGDLETCLVVRARALANARELQDAMRQVRHMLWMFTAIAAVIALLGGAAAAQAVMSTSRHEAVNIFLVLGSLLGLQTVLLLVWFGLLIFARGSARASMTAASLGGIVLAITRKVVRWIHRGSEHTAAVAALSSVMTRSPLGKWTVSTISNGLWLAFNIGALAVVIALLSAKQYAFVWETTILSEKIYVPLTRSIAWLPERVGFPSPTADEIAASQFLHVEGESATQPASPVVQASRAWSGLLVGSIVVYGLAPRLLLLGLSLSCRRGARSRYRIDESRPDVLRMRDRIEPTSRRLAVTDDDDSLPRREDSQRIAGDRPARTLDPPAILGVELAHVPHQWPPKLSAAKSWNDLGMVDRREDRHRVMHALTDPDTQPGALAIVCELATTPDRGLARFVTQAASAVASKTWLVLTGGQQMRDRGEGQYIAQRIEDWRTLAATAGIPADQVAEIDLDHITHATLATLNRIAGGIAGGAESQHARRLEAAFDAIIEFAQMWESDRSEITNENRAKLHQRIASLYRDQSGSWRDYLRVPASLKSALTAGVSDQLPGELLGQIKLSARQFATLLPDRLKRSPRWLAAGATAGALGCVAAATLISPIAIGSLPIWSAIGAAIGAVVQPASRESEIVSAAGRSSQLDATVRSAALLAMVLELQGRDERTITRVLDEALPPDAEQEEFTNAADVRAWLDDVRHRMDLSLARLAE